MAQAVTPNQYDLRGVGTAVSYSTSGLAGQPSLTYTKGRKKLTFNGNEIRLAETELGTLVTVTVAVAVDRGFTTFSFLLPAISLQAASSSQAFRTTGITTAHVTTLAGPAKGPRQTYKTMALRGTARQVQSLAQRAARA